MHITNFDVFTALTSLKNWINISTIFVIDGKLQRYGGRKVTIITKQKKKKKKCRTGAKVIQYLKIFFLEGYFK